MWIVAIIGHIHIAYIPWTVFVNLEDKINDTFLLRKLRHWIHGCKIVSHFAIVAEHPGDVFGQRIRIEFFASLQL